MAKYLQSALNKIDNLDFTKGGPLPLNKNESKALKQYMLKEYEHWVKFTNVPYHHIKCNVCGRYISYSDFTVWTTRCKPKKKNFAIRKLIDKTKKLDPNSYITICKRAKCKKKYAN